MAVTEHQAGYLKWPHTQASKISATRVAGAFIHKEVELDALEQEGQNICKVTAYQSQSNKRQNLGYGREGGSASIKASLSLYRRGNWHAPPGTTQSNHYYSYFSVKTALPCLH